MVDIFEISFNPNDVSFFTCIGKNVFKCFRYTTSEGESN